MDGHRPLTLADDPVASIFLLVFLFSSSLWPFSSFFCFRSNSGNLVVVVVFRLLLFFLRSVAVARVEMASSIYEAKAQKGRKRKKEIGKRIGQLSAPESYFQPHEEKESRRRTDGWMDSRGIRWALDSVSVSIKAHLVSSTLKGDASCHRPSCEAARPSDPTTKEEDKKRKTADGKTVVVSRFFFSFYFSFVLAS